jgi:hypothetical protein
MEVIAKLVRITNSGETQILATDINSAFIKKLVISSNAEEVIAGQLLISDGTTKQKLYDLTIPPSGVEIENLIVGGGYSLSLNITTELAEGEEVYVYVGGMTL